MLKMRVNLLLLALVSPALLCQAQPGDLRFGTYTIYYENDAIAGSDRYYTSGARISWTSNDLEDFDDPRHASPLLPLLERLPFAGEAGFQKNLALSIGQNIYTPDDTESEVLVEDDRPYAGWLYLGLGVVWKDARVRNSFVLNLGIVGPWSLAEETQRLVHRSRGIGFPQGWEHQLANEFGVAAVYERTMRWPYHERRVGFDWELLPHVGFALGNVAIHLNGGAELRAGINLPDDFGISTISPAATTPTPLEGPERAERPRHFDWGLYAFGRAEARLVARDIFLDGNTFATSHSVDRRWLVADFSAGVAMNFHSTKMTYAIVYRTESFEGQKDAQVFGSVTLSVAF